MMTATLESKMIVNPFERKDDDKQKSQIKEDCNADIEEAVRKTLALFSLEEKSGLSYPRLTAEQINSVLLSIIQKYDKTEVEKVETGLFLNRLFQYSYIDLNTKRFVLTTGDYLIPHLFVRPNVIGPTCADIYVEGNIGDDSCILGDANVRIFGNAGSNFGRFSNKSTFQVHGDVSDFLGTGSLECSFTVLGDAGDFLGKYSSDCEFYLGGDIGSNMLFQAEKCMITTPNEDTYKKILDWPQHNSSNHVILTDKNGKELARQRL